MFSATRTSSSVAGFIVLGSVKSLAKSSKGTLSRLLARVAPKTSCFATLPFHVLDEELQLVQRKRAKGTVVLLLNIGPEFYLHFTLYFFTHVRLLINRKVNFAATSSNNDLNQEKLIKSKDSKSRFSPVSESL